MPQEKPEGVHRVIFDQSIPAQVMGIDGTWKRACRLKEVSDSDAKLLVEGSIEGLALNEFFLLLSSTGLAYRRCQLDQVNGAEITVSFLRRGKHKPLDEDPPPRIA
jgi:hypothetical protein